QATFVFCGLLGALSLLLSARTLPAAAETADGERRPLAALVRPLLDRRVAAVLAATVAAVAGNLAFQTYIAVVLACLAGVAPAVLAGVRVGSGADRLLGPRAAGRLGDRFGALRAFLTAGAVFCAAMAAMALLWPLAPVLVWAGVAPLLVAWSAAAWAIPPSLQALMLDGAGAEAAAQAMAVHSSSVYVGAALGGAVGGVVVAAAPGLLPAAAALAVALGLLFGPLARLAPGR